MEFSTLLFVLGVSYALGCDYAQYSPQHTMCVYKGAGCDLMGQGFNDNEIKDVLDAHNKVRSAVATGEFAGQPSAANMKQLVWDDELATIAQRLVDQCVLDHDKNKNRRSHKFTSVGQNLFISMSSAPMNDIDMAAAAVTDWANEVANMNENFIHSFPEKSPPEDKAIGHYTQMVWANTEAVGCGLAYYIEDGWYTKLMGCNYGPAGNSKNMKIYEVGEACSGCSSGCSNKYPGLCQ